VDVLFGVGFLGVQCRGNIYKKLSGSYFHVNVYYSFIFVLFLTVHIILVVKAPYRTRYINLGPVVDQEDKIWTLEVNHEKRETPIVLLHGFASGIGLWCMNVDKISNDRRPVYAMDLLGFGRSSRPNFSTDPEQVEQQYVNSIEKWRSEIKLEKFILLGHSFGGYLATAYSIQHPERCNITQ